MAQIDGCEECFAQVWPPPQVPAGKSELHLYPEALMSDESGAGTSGGGRGTGYAVRSPPVLLAADAVAARERIMGVARLVERIYPELPIDTLAAMACANVGWVMDGRAADPGLQLTSLCAEAGESTKRFRRGLGPGWQQAGELMARLLSSWPRHTLRWERIGVVATRTRPNHNGLGTDKIREKAASIRFLTSAVGNPDRCLVCSSCVYTRGTRDDHSCAERRDLERIAMWTERCGVEIAGTMSEHMELHLGQGGALRHRVERSREAGSLPPRSMVALKRCFPDLVIVGAMPEGPPATRGAWHGTVGYPGDDEQVLATLRAHGKRGIALCSPRTLADAELEQELAGWQTIGVEEGEFARVHALALQTWGTRFRLLAERELLVRDHVGRTSVAGGCWRTFGLEEDLAMAATLIVLAEQEWPEECIERARESNSWGLISASDPWSHGGLRTVSHIADAALVSAERERNALEMRQHDYESPGEDPIAP